MSFDTIIVYFVIILTLGLGVCGSYYVLKMVDCLTLPAENRRRVQLDQLNNSREEIKKQVLDTIFPAKVRFSDLISGSLFSSKINSTNTWGFPPIDIRKWRSYNRRT